MEQKKFDANSFIGLLLLGAIMLWFMYTNQEEIKPAETSVENIIDSTTTTTKLPIETNFAASTDSLANIVLQNQLGAFAFGAQTAKKGTSILENKVLRLVIDNQGGQIIEAQVKNYKTYDSLPLYLIKDKNASFNINFGTTDNRILNTKDLLFNPSVAKNGKNQVLSLKLKVSDSQFLEYRYEMKPDNYMIDFTVRSQGLSSVINGSNTIKLDWNMDGYRHEKSMKTENMYSTFYFENADEVDYYQRDATEIEETVKWAAFKQHFFSSILLTNTPFATAQISTKDLMSGDETNETFTKQFGLSAPLALQGGELNYQMNWYYGPNDYAILKSYENTNISEIVDLGWGIFGFINRNAFIPIFNFLSGWMSNYGLIIILMTIVIRIIMSPLVYKSYVSSAKMKVIRPELQAINDRLPGKENALKRQQETMAVQRKAGVSMLSGCIPALLQMPIFFALFRFFPSNIELRQKGFLWASDLSSYDAIYILPFEIPFYGNHISLFPILASIAIFVYMKMNQSQQANMQAPQQEGMPDMQKMMKVMIYFSPIMMLFFFNNYASSLSLYYFISNLLTIVIMLVIKYYVIDEDKIHAQIEENKKRPEKKKGKFRQRLDDAMKQAQEQQAQQKKRK
uniref:membrane protein insertase YidC n=1 Tax=Polaribacter sp. TaxID=1920175 RepID=UPI0040487F70